MVYAPDCRFFNSFSRAFTIPRSLVEEELNTIDPSMHTGHLIFSYILAYPKQLNKNTIIFKKLFAAEDCVNIVIHVANEGGCSSIWTP